MTTETEKQYIVDTSFNWADEMDVSEFCVISQSQLDKYKKLAKSLSKTEEIEYYCGTNEETYFTRNDILQMLDCAKEITPKELEIINKFVPYGCRNSEVLERLFDDIDEEEEEDEFEDEFDDEEDEFDEEDDEEEENPEYNFIPMRDDEGKIQIHFDN